MRILLLAPHSFYQERGTPMDVDLMLRALSERGDTVDAVVYPGGEDRTYPGVTLHRPRGPRKLHDIGPGFSLKKLAADALLIPVALRLARRNKYDVVHAGEEAVFIAMLLRYTMGLPYVYDMDSSIAQQMVERMPWLRPLAGRFNGAERFATRRCVAAAPVCNALADLARRHGAPHIVTVHDISQLANPDRQATGWLKKQLKTTRSILMYVGNLEPYQGVDLLLEAFAVAMKQGAEVDLVIAGGTERDIERYRRQATTLGLDGRAHLIGPWPADRLDELLAEADILTAPRIRGINTPMKVFPYLHSGRPVLLTDLPTHTQVLTPAVCELAPANPAGMARSIVRLAADEAYRQQLGAAGRAFVEAGHTYDAHRQRVHALYRYVESVCVGSQAPASAKLDQGSVS